MLQIFSSSNKTIGYFRLMLIVTIFFLAERFAPAEVSSHHLGCFANWQGEHKPYRF